MTKHYCTEVLLEVRAFIEVDAESWQEAKSKAPSQLHKAETPYPPEVISIKQIGGENDE